MKTILVTGALGQIGSELVPALRERYGTGRVIASDIRMPPLQALGGGSRFPGLVSRSAQPGGGTTDYAVAIFYDAILHGRYTCFLRPDTQLDMMYMPDALRAILGVMEAEPARLRHRNAFNITAMDFTPAQLAAAIRVHLPDFQGDYNVDPVRQAIAHSCPHSMDDTAARDERGWPPTYRLPDMTRDMLEKLRPRLLAHRAAAG